MGLHDLVPARAEVRGRHRGDPAQHDRRARPRPAARAAAGQGRAVQRARARRRRRRRPNELRALGRAGASCARPRATRSRGTRRSRPRARRSRRPAGLPDLWPDGRRGRLAGPADRRGARRRGLGALRRAAGAEECGRVLAGVPLLGRAAGHGDARGGGRRVAGCRGARRAPAARAFRRARPATFDSGWTVDRAPGRAARRAGGIRRRRHASARGHRRLGARRPGADLLVVVGDDGRRRPVAVALDARRRGRRVEARRPLRRHPLSRPRQARRARAGQRLDVGHGGARRRVVPRPGADRGGVARRGQTCLEVSRRATRRSASRSAARSAPTRRSSTSSTEILRRLENSRGLLVLRRLGARRQARRVPARRQRARARRRVTRWTTPRGR